MQSLAISCCGNQSSHLLLHVIPEDLLVVLPRPLVRCLYDEFRRVYVGQLLREQPGAEQE